MAYTASATAIFDRDTVVYGDLRIGNNPDTPKYVYEYDIFLSFDYASASTLSTTKGLTTATSAVSFTVYSYYDNGNTVDTDVSATLVSIESVLDKAMAYYDTDLIVVPASGGYRYQYTAPTSGAVTTLKHTYSTCKAARIEYDGSTLAVFGSGIEQYLESGSSEQTLVRPSLSLTLTSAMFTNAGTYSYNYSYIRKKKLTVV